MPFLAAAGAATAAESPNAVRQYCVERYPAVDARHGPRPHGMRRHLMHSIAPVQESARVRPAPPPPQASASQAAPPARHVANPAPAADQARPDLYGERYGATEPGVVLNPATEPVSTFGADVDTASYAHVRRWLDQGRLPPADAVRPEELINAFAYDYAAPETAADGFQPTLSLHPAPWDESKRLLHIGVRAYDVPPGDRPPANLALLVDASGSMASADKLGLVRQAICVLAHELEPEDRIGIVAYAGGARVVLDSTEARNRDQILKALDGLQAGGGTAGGAGLRMAYAMARLNFDKARINRVMLATDGDFNVGINDPRELKDFIRRQAADGVYLSVLSVGGGNVRDDMTQALAQNGNGVAVHLDSLAEAERVLVQQMTSTLFTVAKDVKFQVEFNPAMVAGYRLIGYETRKLAEADFANDAKDSGDMGAGHMVTALYELTMKGAGDDPFRPRRYGADGRSAAAAQDDPAENEIAYLRIRFKPVAAGAEASAREQATAIVANAAHASLSEAPADMRFAAAVAWFAQKLRGDALDAGAEGEWDAIASLAAGAAGADPYKERARFLGYIEKAKELDPAG